MSSAAPALVTAEELADVAPPNARTELVRGRLVVREPGGLRHGDGTESTVAADEALQGEHVVPGLAIPLSDILDDANDTLVVIPWDANLWHATQVA